MLINEFISGIFVGTVNSFISITEQREARYLWPSGLRFYGVGWNACRKERKKKLE